MLWGAFNNATQGMVATSWGMNSISQNISNVNTVGYKRQETMFKTLLSGSHASPAGSSGGLDIFAVKAVDRFHIQQQGVLTPSNHWSDLAIAGRGFFMVAPPAAPGVAPTDSTVANPNSVLYTRAGSLNQIAGADDRNYFVTGSGHHLLGWMADETGEVSDAGTLEPLYTLPSTQMPGRPTAEATLIANLPSNTPMTPGIQSTTTSMDTAATGLALPQEVSFTWTRTGPTDWSVEAVPPAGAVVTSGSPFTVSMDGYGTILNNPATFDVGIDWSGVGAGGNPLAVHTLNAASIQPPPSEITPVGMQVFDSNSVSQSIKLGFERVGANEWYLHVPGNATPTSITFDANGRIATGSPTTIDATFTDPAGDTTASFELDLDKMTQFDGDLYINTISQDGYSEGTLRYARFESSGDMIGTFDNGRSLRLAKVPLATFISENQLMPVGGTLFMRTLGAGDISINAVEDVPGGFTRLTANSLENSTVDIGDEFTRMIMTQKAYSSNATVFRTADEMITTAADLKG